MDVAPTESGASQEGLAAELAGLRTLVHQLRAENARTAKAGWLPAVRGGWRRDVRHEDREYLPLTPEVVTAHLSGEVRTSACRREPIRKGDAATILRADFTQPAGGGVRAATTDRAEQAEIRALTLAATRRPLVKRCPERNHLPADQAPLGRLKSRGESHQHRPDVLGTVRTWDQQDPRRSDPIRGTRLGTRSCLWRY